MNHGEEGLIPIPVPDIRKLGGKRYLPCLEFCFTVDNNLKITPCGSLDSALQTDNVEGRLTSSLLCCTNQLFEGARVAANRSDLVPAR